MNEAEIKTAKPIQTQLREIAVKTSRLCRTELGQHHYQQKADQTCSADDHDELHENGRILANFLLVR